ncbi:MAG: hypothetical protein IK024_12830 [Treponema sp.]|nr:hypothetical protein [Treponema sp.]
MISSKGKVRGQITVTVRDCNGKVKYYKNGFWRTLFNLPRKPMIIKHHNTITNQGDGMIADLLISNPTQNKVDATNGYMRVGTGWTGTTPKNNTGVNTPTGSFKKLDSTYPKTSGEFGATGQNVVLYRTSFAAGDLNANGINEVALMNGNTSAAKCLAYAQITPAVNVTSADSLQIDWLITFNGA